MVHMVHITTSRRIADVIQAALEEAGLTLRQAADNAGIPRPTLTRRLASGTGFTVDEIERLADLLGTTVVDLMVQAEKVA